MDEIKLYIKKSVEQNAEIYFEKAKKLKKKVEGARLALLDSQKKLDQLKKENTKEEEAIKKTIRKKEWFEKFRWSYSSEKKMIIAGRDATTNDILIKKHLDSNDLVFHAEIAGSPFCIVKNGKNNCSDSELKQAAQFCGANSKAFRLGISNIDVYWILPEQVSFKAPSGEYLTKGAFMVYGKKTILNTEIKISIGVMEDGKVMAGHIDAVNKNCSHYLNIRPGRTKKSDLAKKIQAHFLKKTNIKVELDEIMQALPPGDGDLEI